MRSRISDAEPSVYSGVENGVGQSGGAGGSSFSLWREWGAVMRNCSVSSP